MLKVWCRDPAHQFAFEPVDSVCWPTVRLGQFRNQDDYANRDEVTRSATQLAVRFRAGHEPDLRSGLDLPADEDDQPPHGG
jgi:hypothetical protein